MAVVRLAEISSNRVRQVVDVLHRERPVEAHVVVELGNSFRCRRSAQNRRSGIARQGPG